MSIVSCLGACGGTNSAAPTTPASASAPSATYSVGGTVNGLANGATLALQNNHADTLTVTSNGAFAFDAPVPANGNYDVTIATQPSGETCSVAGFSGTGVKANVTTVQVTCSTTTFTVGGTLTGLLPGAQVTLENNGADPLTLTTSGPFAFAMPVPYNGSYDVTVDASSFGQMCSVTSGTGNALQATVANVAIACHGLTLTTLHTFAGPPTDGAQSGSALVMDSQGNLFGTTQEGGPADVGTIFEIKSTGPGTWATAATTLYAFSGNADGAFPQSSLIMDSQGNLYGTTLEAGANRGGTVFELQSTGAGTWAAQPITLHAFTGGADGQDPPGHLTMDSQGDLLGTTELGGLGFGTLFALKPAGGAWTFSTLYSFSGGSDGKSPSASLAIDGQGNLFGTTSNAGGGGFGTVFELQSTGPGTWATTVNTLYRFTGALQTTVVPSDLAIDNQGDLFGTALSSDGVTTTLFELPSTGSGTWASGPIALTTVSTGGSADMQLVLDGHNNLFGTAWEGGSAGEGSVYVLPSTGSGTWATAAVTLYSFTGGADGGLPLGSVLIDSQGRLFGTAAVGGTGAGTVFELH